MLPLGQEDSRNRFARLFRQLPLGPFTTIKSTKVVGRTPVIVRSLRHDGRTYVYVVNPTRLAATVQVELQTTGSDEPLSLDGRAAPVLTRQGATARWTLDLEAYDVAGLCFPTNDVQVTDWNIAFDRESVAELSETVQELRVRVDQLNRFQPLAVIENADFEQPARAGQIPGWSVAPTPGVSVELDSNRPFQGSQSLHVRVEGAKTVGWIRSRPFPLPRTGRISVLASVRTRDATQQPPLRVCVDGYLGPGQRFYRWWSLGLDVDGRTFQPTGRKVLAVSQDWPAAPVLFPPIDLPISEAGEISIGIDMVGPGEVWIDDIQVSEVYFDPSELNVLLKNVFNAHFLLREGQLTDLDECQRFLQGYWPRFVLEFVPPPRVSRAAAVPSPVEEKSTKWKFPQFPLKPFLNKPDKGK
jgi:hypothetical protein